MSLPFVGLRIRWFYFGGGQTLYQHGKTLKRLDQFDEILKAYKGDDSARAAIVRDVMTDRDRRPKGARLALAHRRVDVEDLNAANRASWRARGELQNEKLCRTIEGKRAFAPGGPSAFPWEQPRPWRKERGTWHC